MGACGLVLIEIDMIQSAVILPDETRQYGLYRVFLNRRGEIHLARALNQDKPVEDAQRRIRQRKQRLLSLVLATEITIDSNQFQANSGNSLDDLSQ